MKEPIAKMDDVLETEKRTLTRLEKIKEKIS